MSIATNYLEASKKGTHVNGQNITLQVYNAEMNHLVNIEQIVKELVQLAEDYKKTTSNEPLKSAKNSNNNFRFGVLHQIYRFVVSLVNCVTLMITFDDNELKSSNRYTILNVLMLNIISFSTRFIHQIKQFIMVYAENPQLINVYLTFIGIPFKVYIVFLMVMTATTLRLRSFLTGLMFFTIVSSLLILSFPLILMLISSLLFVAISISITSTVSNQVVIFMKRNVPTREFLTYIADKIPPSVGRVEVTHKQQGK